MILTAFHGFRMALADSVPGVSGGTIVFILGFYERFLDALHNVVQGSSAARKDACTYLLKLGVGWAIGMGSCVVLLSSLFEQNIYFMSSLFLGLTVSSIPFVVAAERGALKNLRSAVFLLLGAGVVVELTLLRAHAGLWRAGRRGYIHQCYPRRAAKVPQPDDLADLGPDAWLTVRHRQWPRKFGRAAPGAEYGDLPACRLCVGRYRAAGAGRCKNDDGT